MSISATDFPVSSGEMGLEHWSERGFQGSRQTEKAHEELADLSASSTRGTDRQPRSTSPPDGGKNRTLSLRAEVTMAAEPRLPVSGPGVQRQGPADANEYHETFSLSLDLLSRVLLQPLALLTPSAPHSPVPVQRGLSVHLELLFPVSAEPGSHSGFPPDVQPAGAYKQAREVGV